MPADILRVFGCTGEALRGIATVRDRAANVLGLELKPATSGEGLRVNIYALLPRGAAKGRLLPVPNAKDIY